MNQLIKRLVHARHRKKQALRNFYVKKSQSLLRIESKPTTEINYLVENRFETKVLSRLTLTSAAEVSFDTPDGLFKHNFNSTEIVTLNCAVVDTEYNYIYAISKEGYLHLLEESSDWSAVTSTQLHKPTNSLPKVSVSDVSLGLGSRGFYHMISEDLSRINQVEKTFKVIQYSKSSKNLFEILKTMPVEIIRVPRFIQVKNLSFITHGKDLGYLNLWQLNSLKKNFKDQIRNNRGDKVYISRSLTRRSPSFEIELMDRLQKLGFKIVHLENLGFEHQINLFSSAGVVVGVHGAGLTGSLWSHKPLVIELMEDNYFNRCFEWQTLINRGQYQRIVFSSRDTDAEIIYSQIIKKLNAI